MLQTLDIATLVECGAHEGSASSKFATELGKRAIAIEANPFVFKEKTSQLKEFGVTALNYALDTKDGQVTLKVPIGKQKTSTKGSLLPREDRGTEEVACEAKTLDSVAAEHFPEDVSFGLWIDVEGATSQVLRGADRILRNERCKLIKVEVESVSFWKDQSTAFEIDAFLKDRGFFPVARDCEYKEEYNLIYISIDCLQAVEGEVFLFWQNLSRTKLSLYDLAFPFSIGRNRLASSPFDVLRRQLARLSS